MAIFFARVEGVFAGGVARGPPFMVGGVGGWTARARHIVGPSSPDC